MEPNLTISEFADTVRARSAAYAEEAAARGAVEIAERRLKSAARDVLDDYGFDPVMSATLRGRVAIARIRVEEARERLREARRDLLHTRQLSAPEPLGEYQ